ncbi:hypothetical protein [Actinoplanes sp. NPDC049265]|uniref:hypothetical protein n=1 Tax=Actinoplanes sp. NPDC049265 TaxID=3363902 RepID=UPI003719996F
MNLVDRFLLTAYPPRLRRRHGTELMITLNEMTDGRPSRTDRVRLLADGLAARFRPPVRWPLGILTAVLAMLVGGAAGLVAGSWAGEQAHPSMPAVAPLAARILGPDDRPEKLERSRFELSFTTHPISGEATGAETSPPADPSGANGRPAPVMSPAAAAAMEREVRGIHQRLAADGWEVTAVQRYRGLDQWSFWARSGDLKVSVSTLASAEPFVQVMGYPMRPAAYLPLLLGGLLAGLLGGWLTGAALAHRLAASRHRFPSMVVAAVGAAIMVAPVVRAYHGLVLYLRTDDGYGVGALAHDALAWMPWPLRDTSVFPDSVWPGVRTLLIGLAVVALAAVLARRPDAAERDTDSELEPVAT